MAHKASCNIVSSAAVSATQILKGSLSIGPARPGDSSWLVQSAFAGCHPSVEILIAGILNDLLIIALEVLECPGTHSLLVASPRCSVRFLKQSRSQDFHRSRCRNPHRLSPHRSSPPHQSPPHHQSPHHRRRHHRRNIHHRTSA